jgi:hypothetical protein
MSIRVDHYPATLLPQPAAPVAPPAAAPARPPADPGLAARVWNAATGAWSYLRGAAQPVHAWGQRYMPFSSPFPKNPYAALSQLEAQATAFGRIQQTLPFVEPLSTSTPQNISSASATSLSAQVAQTQAELRKLSRQLSSFTILYALHWAANKTNDDQVAEIFEMTHRAAEPGAPSLKQLVFNQYANLNCFRRLLVHVLYFICTFRGLVEKTIEAYANQLVAEGRSGLTRALEVADESQSSLAIPDLIDDFGAFFRAYADATIAHAKGIPLIGLNGAAIPHPTLRQYKEITIQRLYGKSLRTLCSEITLTLVRKIAPKVEYKKGAWILNPLMNGAVKWFLRLQLPSVLNSALQKVTEETKPYKRPFVKAICEVLIDLLEDLKKTHEEGDLDPPPNPFPGTKDAPALVAEFLRVLDIGEHATRREVLALAALQEQNLAPDDIHEALGEALTKGVNAALYYLARPENREKTLTKTIRLLGIPFSATQHVTKKQLDTVEGQLSELGRQLVESFVEEAVEDKLRQGPRRDVVDRVADRQFATRKRAAQELSAKLERTQATIAQHLQRHTLAQPNGWVEIQKELIAAKDTLTHFALVEQQSRAEFAHLPAADQEAILRPLLPIYDQTQNAMAQLLEFEQALRVYYSSSVLSADYRELYTFLERLDASYNQGLEAANLLSQMGNEASTEQRRALHTQLENSTQQIRESIVHFEQILARIQGELTREESASFTGFLNSCRAMEAHFQQVSALHHFDLQLRFYLDNPRAAPKPLDLARFTPAHQAALSPLIIALGAHRSDTPNPQIIQALGAQLSHMQYEMLSATVATQRQIQHSQIPLHMRRLAGIRQQQQQDIQVGLVARLDRACQHLAQTSGAVQDLIENAQREHHYQITDNVLGAGAGAVGAAAGAILTPIVPGAGLLIPAAVGAANGSVEPIVSSSLGQPVSYIQPALSAAAGIGAATLLAPFVGPIAAAAVVGGGGLAWTGLRARGRAVTQAKTTVVGPILTLLFERGRGFSTNDFVYKGTEKILLNRVITAYADVTT